MQSPQKQKPVQSPQKQKLELRVEVRPANRAFAAITQAPALLAVAWLVPGTAMLLAGRLSPLPMAIIFVALAVALCYFAMRRLPTSWSQSGETGPISALAVLLMVAIAGGFGLWQAHFRSEQVFTPSDPGVYLQYGYWIAEHGTARIPLSAAAFGHAAGLNFATTGFTVSGASITPSFLPGLPLILAGGTWLSGLGGALMVPALLGGCALLSFAGLVGRLCGAWWAVAAELVLALCLPEVYVARTPFSEPLVQVLLFGGLCLFIDSLVIRNQAHDSKGAVLAGLGGLAMGLTVLASIGSLGLLLPAFPVVAGLYIARQQQAGPLALGLFSGTGIGLAAGLVLARSYLATLSTQTHLIALCAAGLGVATALAMPLAFPGARARVRRMCAYNVRFPWFGGQHGALPSLGAVAQWLALVLPVVVLVGLAERPYFQTVRGQTDPSMIRAVAALQRLERLPVDGLRQYYEKSFYWVVWYLGVPAVLLACLGAAAFGRRVVQAVLGEASPDASSFAIDSGSASSLRLWGLPLLLGTWSVVTVLWDPFVVPWQPAASHRLVPEVLPVLVLLAIWVASWLTSRASLLGASRAASTMVGVCCVIALAVPALVTTLNPALSARPSVGQSSSDVAKLISRVQLRGVGASAAYAGSVSAVSALCDSIGPSASVLFADSASATMFGPAVRGLCDQPVALVVPASAAGLEQAVRSVEQAGRRPVLLGASRSSVLIAGAVPRQVISLRTTQDPEELTGPPPGTWPVTYSLWLAAPSGTGPQ